MGLYEGIKDVAKIVQQADNIELYRQLLDLSAQALELQSEVARLTAENEKLQKRKILIMMLNFINILSSQENLIPNP